MLRTVTLGKTNPDRCFACSVRPLSICDALDPADLAEFERISRQVHHARGEALFTAGAAADAVHSLTSGAARLYKLLPDGRRQIIGFALPGDFLGLAPSDRYGFSADAIDAMTTCRISRDAFNAFSTRELMLAQEQMLLLGRRTAEEKVASFLVGWRQRLARTGDTSQTITLPMSRQDIADYLGLTIETVSRTLTRFEREKMLVIVSGGVRLLDASRAGTMAAG
jgi:CRP/FNR family transcriptional regulator, anaerobic regulatory protein